jgi:hypothetical protein
MPSSPSIFAFLDYPRPFQHLLLPGALWVFTYCILANSLPKILDAINHACLNLFSLTLTMNDYSWLIGSLSFLYVCIITNSMCSLLPAAPDMPSRRYPQLGALIFFGTAWPFILNAWFEPQPLWSLLLLLPLAASITLGIVIGKQTVWFPIPNEGRLWNVLLGFVLVALMIS